MTDPVEPAFVEAFATRWVAAVNAHDPSALLEMCTQRVVFKDPAYDQPFVGSAAVCEALDAIFTAFPDLAFHLQAPPLLSSDRTVAAISVRMTGTMSGPLDPPGFAPTHAPIVVEAVELYRFLHDKVCRIDLVFDMLDLGRQIGAAPPAGSAADRIGTLLQRRTARRMRRRADGGPGSLRRRTGTA